MTLEDAAQAAADREGLRDGIAAPYVYGRNLYVRAFRAGAQWQHQQVESDLNWVRAQRDVAEEKLKEAATKEIALLASAMKKVLPPDLLAEVLAHCDPLTPFLKAIEDARVEPLTNAPSPSRGDGETQ
jgi:hypothetical protein